MLCWCTIRTTISIAAAVLEDLKRRAAGRGTTVSRLIEDSVRLSLAQPPELPAAPEAFELVTYGRDGRFTHLDVDRGGMNRRAPVTQDGSFHRNGVIA